MLKVLKSIFADQGVLLLAVLLPLAYPLLYSWIYTNEVVHDVPVCIVDESRSELSRQFTRAIDASPELSVAQQCADIRQAEALMASQKAYGIIYFPRDFSHCVERMEQAKVGVYVDMSFMIYYKAIFLTLTNLSLSQSSQIQLARMPLPTRREGELQTASIKIEEVQAYNTTGGYGNFLLQAVLVLILQQTLILALCMHFGRNERRERLKWRDMGREYLSLSAAFGFIYLISSAYVLYATPRFFGFTQHIAFLPFMAFILPTLFAFLSFAMAIGILIRKREESMIFIVFTSVPLLFLMGFSWPEASIPTFWECIAWLFPSTPAARAFVRLNVMECSVGMVAHYLFALIVQGLFYAAVFFLLRRKCSKDE